MEWPKKVTYIDYYATIQPFYYLQNVQKHKVFQTLSEDKQTQIFYHKSGKQVGS